MNKSKMMDESFGNGASPFMRWTLSPFLLLFGTLFTFQLPDALDQQQQVSIIGLFLLVVLCASGILALWGVPYIGRLVSAIIATAFIYYVVAMIQDFDGNWGSKGTHSNVSLLGSIMAFFVFGLPCVLYTLFGRFSLLKKEEDANDPYEDEPYEDEPY